MRFSEMMGSAGERAPKSRTRSGTDTAVADTADAAVADALAPYLDAGSVATDTVATQPVAPLSAPLDVAIPLDPTPARRAWPVERPVPVEPPVEATLVSAAPEPIADFTPLSDDLLPRRR